MPLINLKRLMRNQKKYNIELNSGKEATDFVHQRNRLHVNQAPGMAQASGRHDRVPGYSTYKDVQYQFNDIWLLLEEKKMMMIIKAMMMVASI